MLSRATILLTISQAVFLLSGFLIHAVLARLLGVEDYGTFGLVMSILVIVELFVITGIPEAIQKFGGSRPNAMYGLVKTTLPWQLIYVTVILVLFWLVAPLWASGLGDTRLTILLRIASFDIVFYGMYKYYLGVQNGMQRFVQYTILGIFYSISKLIAIASLAWLGYSVPGAIIGNMLGSVIALGLAWAFSRLPETNEDPGEIPYVTFVVQNIFYFVGLNLFFAIDIWFVKHYLSDYSVGLYISSSTLAKVTYMFSIALSAVLLPSLARSIELKQVERVREITQDSLRYLMIFLALIIVVMAINSRGIIALFFGERFTAASPSLILLTIGYSLVTMMAIINTIMIANDKMKACFIIISGLIVVDVVLNLVLVPRYELLGAALATTVVGLVGTVWGGIYIFEAFKRVVLSLSALRIAGTALLVFALSSGLNLLPSDAILKSVLISGVYFLVLWLTRELSTIDIRRLKESAGIS